MGMSTGKSSSSLVVELDDAQTRAVLTALQSPHFLEPVFDRTGARMVSRMHKTPPPPPNSTYRRTGTYARRWTFEPRRTLFSVGVEVGNITEYGPYVGDPELQADIHRGRWQTTAEALEAETPAILDDVTAAIEKQIDGAL